MKTSTTRATSFRPSESRRCGAKDRNGWVGSGRDVEACIDPEASIIRIYPTVRDVIEKKLAEFSTLWIEGGDVELFSELVFCLLTPGARARSAWQALRNLTDTGMLYRGTPSQIAEHLNTVRFKNNKARNIVEARERFMAKRSDGLRASLLGLPDVRVRREWLVANVRGMGYKEASHFLRNIGFGEGIAILDRHVLRNLCACGLFAHVPESLPRKRYLEIEEMMRSYAEAIGIPLSHLDMVLWYKETGDIFK